MSTRLCELELFFAPFLHIALGTDLISRLFAGGAVWIPRKFDPGTALAAIAEGCTRDHRSADDVRGPPRPPRCARPLRQTFAPASVKRLPRFEVR